MNLQLIKQYFYRNSACWVKKLSDVYKYGEGAAISFSQSGEDMVLRHLLRDKPNGFFVDVGANNPIRFSNTFYFYLRGWKGINVDPIPGVMKNFNKLRPRDINIEKAVGKRGISKFFMFEESCYNTFDEKIAETIQIKKISNLISKIDIQKIPLIDLFKDHVFCSIDFLTIDAEGLDIEILETNDWEKFRPLYICIEKHTTDADRTMNPDNFLNSNGYKCVAQTEFSSIFKSLN